jgi:hypothetical protein
MHDQDNRKDFRRQKFVNKNLPKREKISDEQRFLSKSKKEKKQKIEDLREEELWEDWNNEIS